MFTISTITSRNNYSNRQSNDSENKEIKKGDRIYATLSRRGKVIAKIESNDFNSLTQISDSLKELGGKESGLTELFIRNASRYWQINKLIYLHSTSTIHNSYSIS